MLIDHRHMVYLLVSLVHFQENIGIEFVLADSINYPELPLYLSLQCWIVSVLESQSMQFITELDQVCFDEYLI